MSEQDIQLATMNRFIALANEIKDEKVPVHVVS